MRNPDWAIVLRYLYNHSGKVALEEGTAPTESTRSDSKTRAHQYESLNDLLSTRTGVAHTEIEEVVQHLTRVDLVDLTTSSGNTALSLSPDGFDVAHEREINERRQSTNRILSVLTAGLVFGAVTQGVGAYYSTSPGSQAEMGVTMVAIGGVIILIIAALYWAE